MLHNLSNKKKQGQHHTTHKRPKSSKIFIPSMICVHGKCDLLENNGEKQSCQQKTLFNETF